MLPIELSYILMESFGLDVESTLEYILKAFIYHRLQHPLGRTDYCTAVAIYLLKGEIVHFMFTLIVDSIILGKDKLQHVMGYLTLTLVSILNDLKAFTSD